MALDKNKIKKSFSRSSTTYDQYASLQNKIGQELIRKLPTSSKYILDIGMGTGTLLLNLNRQKHILHGCDIAFGMCSVTAEKSQKFSITNADAEFLPYQAEKFDIVLSNLTFQWLPNLTRAFTEIKRVLKKNGVFYLTIFGESTLSELKNSCLATCQNGKKIQESLHFFPNLKHLKEILTALNFNKIKTRQTIKIENYPDTKTLLKTLKYIGAKNASLHTKSGIIILPKNLKKMCSYYENTFQEKQGIRATYEIYTLSGQK